jgi:hypothetical protein
MAEERRQKPRWWIERQGESLREKARHEFESSPAGRRLKERLVLRPYVRDEKEAYIGENSK